MSFERIRSRKHIHFFFQAEDGIRYCLLSRGLGVLLSVAALVAICSPQLEMLFTEDGQTVHAVFGILLKLFCAGALALPVKLTAPRE